MSLPFELYLITPERPASDILQLYTRALSAAPPGRIALQLRAPALSDTERAELARGLRALTARCRVALLISADLELARAVGADGVQLPERGESPTRARATLGAHALVGASRHDRAGIAAAAAAGADFATLSPVFAVRDKGTPLGLAGFAELATDAPLPLVALGGVRGRHVAALRARGAHGIAVIREVADAPRPEAAVAALIAALDTTPAHPG